MARPGLSAMTRRSMPVLNTASCLGVSASRFADEPSSPPPSPKSQLSESDSDEEQPTKSPFHLPGGAKKNSLRRAQRTSSAPARQTYSTSTGHRCSRSTTSGRTSILTLSYGHIRLPTLPLKRASHVSQVSKISQASPSSSSPRPSSSQKPSSSSSPDEGHSSSSESSHQASRPSSTMQDGAARKVVSRSNSGSLSDPRTSFIGRMRLWSGVSLRASVLGNLIKGGPPSSNGRSASKTSLTSSSTSRSSGRTGDSSKSSLRVPGRQDGRKNSRQSGQFWGRISQAGSFVPQIVKPLLKRQDGFDFRKRLTKTNCANVFHIRAEWDSFEDEQDKLLRMLQPHGSSSWRHSILGVPGEQFHLVLKFLTVLTMIYSPLQLAVESTCHRRERAWFSVFKAIHLAVSLLYLGLALVARFAFTAVDLAFGVELFDFQDIFTALTKKSTFWLDVLSMLSLPFEIYHMTEQVDSGNPSWVQKLIAFFTLCRSWRFMDRSLRVDTQGAAWRWRLYAEVASKCGNLLLIFHLFACAWACLGVVQDQSSWSDNNVSGCGRLYLTSLYFTVATATSVGFGDIVPVNGLERALSVVMMITGQMIMAEILAHMHWVTQVANFDRAQHIRKVTKTCASLKSLQVPHSTSERVLAFIDYTGIARKDLNVKKYLKVLSYPIRTEILLTMYYDLVIACPFFKDQSLEVILFVMHSLTDRAYLPGDILFQSNTVARELFFIRTGEVALVEKLNLLKKPNYRTLANLLSSGDFFGETCMLMGSRYTANAVTTTYCVLSILMEDSIHALERKFPEGFGLLLQSAQQICQKNSTLTWARVWETLHERFEDEEEAFEWMQGDSEDGLTGIQFADGMSKLGIKRFDAQVLWASTELEKADKSQHGFMTKEEFCNIGLEQAKLHHVVCKAASAMTFQETEDFNDGPSSTVRKGTEKLKKIMSMAAMTSSQTVKVFRQSTSSASSVVPAETFNADGDLVYTVASDQGFRPNLEMLLKTKGSGRTSLLSRRGLLYQRSLRHLAVIIVLLAPSQVFEAVCQDDERELVFISKVILLICSAIYSLLALPAQFLFAAASMVKGIEEHDFIDVLRAAMSSPQFWLDILSSLSLPFEIFRLYREPSSPSWTDIIIVVTLLRGFRIFAVVLKLHARVNIALEAAWLFVLLLLKIHVAGCAWGLLGIVQWQQRPQGDPVVKDDWVTHAVGKKLLPQNFGCVDLYVSSLYYASSAVTSVGYGDFIAVNNSEYVMSVVMMLAGQVLIAQVFALLNWATSTARQIHAEHVSKVSDISTALDDLQIPAQLRQRVLALTDYVQLCQRQRAILPLLQEVSPPLQLSVRSALYSQLVCGCPFFHNMGQSTIDLVIRSLMDHAFLPNDFIFTAGDLGTDMYFIRTGEISLIKQKVETSFMSAKDFSDEFKRLKPGAYFGELAALMGGAERKLTAVSHGYSILSVLPAAAFKILEQEHPAPYVKLVRNAQDMLKAYLQVTHTWIQVSLIMLERCGSIDAAFEWIQGGVGSVDKIHIAAFTDALKKLGIDRFTTHALWIEVDTENEGFLTFEEFETCLSRALPSPVAAPPEPKVGKGVRKLSVLPTSGRRTSTLLSVLPNARTASPHSSIGLSIPAPSVSFAPSGSFTSSVPPALSFVSSQPYTSCAETLAGDSSYIPSDASFQMKGSTLNSSLSFASDMGEEQNTMSSPGSKQSGILTPSGSSRLTLRETRNSLAKHQSENSDYSLTGPMFGLRMFAEQDEQNEQLDCMLYSEGEKLRYSIVGRYGRIYRQSLYLLATLSCIFMPLQLATEPAANRSELDAVFVLKVMHLICSLLYTLLALPCRLFFTVADVHQCVEHHDFWQVVRFMLTSFGFWVDILAAFSIPFELVHLNEESSVPTSAQYLMFLAFFRTWRLLLPSVSFSRQAPLHREVIVLPAVLLMEIHLITCFWAFMGLAERRSGGTMWMQDLAIDSSVSLYIQAFFFAAYTVTGVGYGNMVPVNAQERVVSVVVMVVGQMSIAEIFARITWVTQMYNCVRAEHTSKVMRLSDALRQLRLADDFHDRVLAHTDYCHLYMKESAIRRHFEDLSPALVSELRLAVNFDLVIKCPFFQDQPVAVVRLVVNLLKEQAYLPQDFIFKQGIQGSELYLIRTGMVSMLDPDNDYDALNANELTSLVDLSEGDYLGEVSLLTGRPHRLSAIARRYCNINVLTTDDFETLDAACPGFLLTLMRSAKLLVADLDSAVTWAEVSEKLMDKFGDADMAFMWLCRDDNKVMSTLTLEAFKISLQSMGYSRYAALCLWANCCKDNAHTMSLSFFCDIINKSKPSSNESPSQQLNNSQGPVPVISVTAAPAVPDRSQSRSQTWSNGTGLWNADEGLRTIEEGQERGSIGSGGVVIAQLQAEAAVAGTCGPADSKNLPPDANKVVQGSRDDGSAVVASSEVAGVTEDGQLSSSLEANDDSQLRSQIDPSVGDDIAAKVASSTPDVAIEDGQLAPSSKAEASAAPNSASDADTSAAPAEQPLDIAESLKQVEPSSESDGLPVAASIKSDEVTEGTQVAASQQAAAPSPVQPDANTPTPGVVGSSVASPIPTLESIHSPATTLDEIPPRRLEGCSPPVTIYSLGSALSAQTQQENSDYASSPTVTMVSVDESFTRGESPTSDTTPDRPKVNSRSAREHAVENPTKLKAPAFPQFAPLDSIASQESNAAPASNGGDARGSFFRKSKSAVSLPAQASLYTSEESQSRKRFTFLNVPDRGSRSIVSAVRSATMPLSVGFFTSEGSGASFQRGVVSFRSSLAFITDQINARPSVQTRQEKYNGINCCEYEIQARAKSTAKEQSESLARMLHVIGGEKRRSIAVGYGASYQNLVRWLSLCIINIAALRLALPTSCSNRFWITVLGILHGWCSMLFIILALPTRMLFSVVDLQLGKEWNEYAAVKRWMLRAPGSWLVIAFSLSFAAECVLVVSGLEPSEFVRVLLMVSRALCGWHAYRPVVRIGTRQISLTTKSTSLLTIHLMEIHIIACIWLYLTSSEDAGNNWTHLIGSSMSCAELYTYSFYFIGYTVTATGYGDVLPANDFEQIISVAVMVSGTFLMARICASLNFATKTHNFRRAQHVSTVSQIAAALETLGTQPMLNSRVFALLEYTALCHREAEVSQHFGDFSPPLRTEFCISRYDSLLRKCSLLSFHSSEVFQFFFQNLRDQVYLPNDYVFWVGDAPTTWYFVRLGQVTTFRDSGDDDSSSPGHPSACTSPSVASARDNIRNSRGRVSLGSSPPNSRGRVSFNSSNRISFGSDPTKFTSESTDTSSPSETRLVELEHFQAGDHFGEVAVLFGQVHPVSAVATIYCILSGLALEIFEDLQKDYPHAYISLLKSMKERSPELQLKATVTWKQLSALLVQRFGNRERAFSSMLPKGEPVVGSVIPMARFINILSKIGVSKYDAQSLWLQIAFPPGVDATVLGYETFCMYVDEDEAKVKQEEYRKQRKKNRKHE